MIGIGICLIILIIMAWTHPTGGVVWEDGPPVPPKSKPEYTWVLVKLGGKKLGVDEEWTVVAAIIPSKNEHGGN